MPSWTETTSRFIWNLSEIIAECEQTRTCSYFGSWLTELLNWNLISMNYFPTLFFLNSCNSIADKRKHFTSFTIFLSNGVSRSQVHCLLFLNGTYNSRLSLSLSISTSLNNDFCEILFDGDRVSGFGRFKHCYHFQWFHNFQCKLKSFHLFLALTNSS